MLSLAIAAALAPAIFAAGWFAARWRLIPPQDGRIEVFESEIEALRDEIWVLKGAAAERDRAEAANEAKSRFLATVSHEMRTPLNGILGMADLARGPNLSAEQTYYLEMIRASGSALTSLIEEVLDFSKIEAGKLDLVSAPFEVIPLVERVVELLAPRAQGKGLEIACTIAADVPRSLSGDAARLQQVLVNLAGNAVKFTETGGVGLRVSRLADGAIRFTVSDTGPGIPEDRRDAVFLDFEQADGSATRKHEGTGLGLAISRRIVEGMGGSLALAATGQQGSVFTCDLPLHTSGAAVGTAPALPGRRVMVAANSPFEAPYLAERLAGAGAFVQHALGATQALEIIASSEAFDIVIADCALGEEAARSIAKAARTSGAGRSLVLFSPFERRALGQNALQDFDGWLVKPVRTATLAARLLGEKTVETGGEDSAKPLAGRAAGLSILLAEDNDINALIATKHLQQMGASVTRARDGTQALELALASLRGESAKFDMVLLDIRMPGMDGIEVARRIREAENQLRLPPIRMAALTANAFEEDRKACLAAGIDEFLTKPLDIAKLARALPQPGEPARKAS